MISVTSVDPSGSKHTDDKLHVEVEELSTVVVFVAVAVAHASLYASLTIYYQNKTGCMLIVDQKVKKYIV